MSKKENNALTLEDIDTIFKNTASSFTRQRDSKIKQFLLENKNAVVISRLNKSRGASVKFYRLTSEGVVKNNEYVKHNAAVLLKALENKNAIIKDVKEL